MELKVAKIEDLERICQFYQDVCEHQAFDEYGADWHWGIYPDCKCIQDHIEASEIYYLENQNDVCAVSVVVRKEDEMYQNAQWKYAMNESSVAVFHLLAIHPKHRSKKLGTLLVESLFALLKQSGIEVIHLDVVKGNLPAIRLYEKSGFEFLEERDVFYEDTGDITVALYEKKL